VADGFSGSGKIVFLQQRIQVLVDMYRRVIPISMGRSGVGLLVVSDKEVHVVFFKKLLKYSVDKFSSFVCL
jgi:hypothetical protein